MTDHRSHFGDEDDTGLAAFDIYAPPGEPDGADDDIPDLVFSAHNAADTVSVSAHMDGSIDRVQLAPAVSAMTEAELAREILAVAAVAAAKGRAAQYELVSGMLRMQGQDAGSTRELLERGLKLPTPEQAAEAEAALAARRFS